MMRLVESPSDRVRGASTRCELPSHTAAAVSAVFDEPNLVSCDGLVPVLRLAKRAGLHGAAARRVRLPVHASVGASSASPSTPSLSHTTPTVRLQAEVCSVHGVLRVAEVVA